MKVKNIIDEDFIKYRLPSMVIGFPKCNFKCENECAEVHCQNRQLALQPDIQINIDKICERYLNNPITKAIVCAGLEPFDSIDDLIELVKTLRVKYKCNDTIVIYTGYYSYEITDVLAILGQYSNIIVKVGRYKINDKPHYDELLGVDLASDNQKAIQLS